MDGSRRGWMLAIGCCGVSAMLAAAPLAAQERTDTTQTHVVRRGDTLWDLARRYLGDPFRWPDIFGINRERVADPDLILPEWRLRIPGLAQRPGAPEAPPIFRTPAAAVGPTVFAAQAAEPVRNRLLLDSADEAPAVAEGDFLRAGLLVAETEVSPVGRLAELVNPSVVRLDIPQQIAPYARVYMTLDRPGSVAVGDRFHLMRAGRHVEGYGRIFESTGVARVLKVDGAVATVEVERLFDKVRVGDLAVPLPSLEMRPGLRPGGITAGARGTLVAFQKPHAIQIPQELAFVDLGRASGVEVGDELVVVLPPEEKAWGIRPEIVVARLQVVRAAGRTAAVKVIALEQPALRSGLPVRVVAKMP